MMAMIESLWLQSGPYLRATRELMHSDERPTAEFHAAIVQAIEQRDAGKARLAMEREICWAFDKLTAHRDMLAGGFTKETHKSLRSETHREGKSGVKKG